MPKTQFCGYICGIMTTYQQILIILDNFEINFIGALFPPGTAVAAPCPHVGLMAKSCPVFVLNLTQENPHKFFTLFKRPSFVWQ